MAQHRSLFRDGARRRASPASADAIFDLMEKFAGYGFNKSHAAAYSLLAYHGLAQVHHPAEFFAANMTIEIDDGDKLRVLVRDARQFGIEFERPDVNRGTWGFEPVADDRVRFGLGAIKGTGQGAIEAIVAARRGRPVHEPVRTSASGVDRTRMNKRALEALVKAGAFDAIHADRAALLASVGPRSTLPTRASRTPTRAACSTTRSRTRTGRRRRSRRSSPPSAWPLRQQLSLEKSALGFYLSGHLFDESADGCARSRQRIADLADSREPQLVAGIVSDLRLVSGLRGRQALFRLDDKSDAIEAVASEELLQEHRDGSGRRTRDRAGPGAAGPLLRRPAPRGAAGVDLPPRGCRFGYLEVEVNGSVPPVAEVLREFPSRSIATEHGELAQGLSVRLRLKRGTASAELDLGAPGALLSNDADAGALARGGRC